MAKPDQDMTQVYNFNLSSGQSIKSYMAALQDVLINYQIPSTRSASVNIIINVKEVDSDS